MSKLKVRITSAGVHVGGLFVPLSKFNTSQMDGFTRGVQIELSFLHVMKRWLQFIGFAMLLFTGFFAIATVSHDTLLKNPLILVLVALGLSFCAHKEFLFAARLYVTEVITAAGDVVFSYERHQKEQINLLDSRLVKAFGDAKRGVDSRFVLNM